MKLGNAKYGGERKKRKYFRLKDGEATFRILPPMGNLADKGVWSVFYSVHFGYKNSKDQLRPFQSPLVKNNKTKMIEVPDAALDRLLKLKAQYEDAKKSGNQELVKKLEPLVGMEGRYSLDKNHHLNVVDAHGNIGVLQLRHKAKLALDAEIKRLRESGIDPLSIEDGRFFTFRRTGMGSDTSFSVIVAKEKLNVQGVGVVERDIVHKIDADLIKRLKDEAVELDTLFKKPTAEEVKRIVEEGAKAVDEILDRKTEAASVEDTTDYEDLSEDLSEPTTTQAAPVAASSAVGQETKAAVQETPKAEASATTTDAQKIAEMSEADFLKSLGL